MTDPRLLVDENLATPSSVILGLDPRIHRHGTPQNGRCRMHLLLAQKGTIADGKVKPAHAASAPEYPPRDRPSAMPTWLLAGPGKNWQSATQSA